MEDNKAPKSSESQVLQLLSGFPGYELRVPVPEDTRETVAFALALLDSARGRLR